MPNVCVFVCLVFVCLVCDLVLVVCDFACMIQSELQCDSTAHFNRRSLVSLARDIRSAAECAWDFPGSIPCSRRMHAHVPGSAAMMLCSNAHCEV